MAAEVVPVLGLGALVFRAMPAPADAKRNERGSIMTIDFPSTRSGALQVLKEFLPKAPRYARDRNHVRSGHPHVSRLSPALRHRLLLEDEIAETVLDHHPFDQVEKFLQEVWWRRYWKAWLERRPAVWRQYRTRLASFSSKLEAKAEQVAEGGGGIAIMDHFARELRETGYLHNHARMWWASYWIHIEGLPWELGAEFFRRHLRDADPASNTLSWRWVAGLHTPGKAYLVTRRNVQRYGDPSLLLTHSSGLERLEGGAVRPPREDDFANPDPDPVDEERWRCSEGPGVVEALSADPPSDEGKPLRWGLWLHDEDLLPEQSPLVNATPSALAITTTSPAITRQPEGTVKRDHRFEAAEDGLSRAQAHFGLVGSRLSVDSTPLVSALVGWARQERLRRVVTLRPFVGTLRDELPSLEIQLAQNGCRLMQVGRASDAELFEAAKSGFFGFWKRTGARTLRSRAIAP